MAFSRTAIYALRALAVLKELEPATSMPGDSLSTETGVPRDYLAKVMRQLARAGFVAAQRGRGGGFRLAKPARSIRLLDVLQAVDNDLAVGECAFRGGPCNTSNPCMLHGAWSELKEAVESWSLGTTVADLTTHAVRPSKRRSTPKG